MDVGSAPDLFREATSHHIEVCTSIPTCGNLAMRVYGTYLPTGMKLPIHTYISMSSSVTSIQEEQQLRLFGARN
jgi:hypothetical protein